MFRVDLSENRILKLDQKRFADFGLRERKHLQQWMADAPDALGEELLIIQQEFDGFADTRERLDLLALDKSGQLVIIENKLDDTGRDVVWQALKVCRLLLHAQEGASARHLPTVSRPQRRWRRRGDDDLRLSSTRTHWTRLY